MAKKNNKGFSLVEIIIAIAILTLLITPVITQLAQTMKVNRQSKLQQYVNDDATKFLEEIKSTNTVDLDIKYGPASATHTCKVIDSTGTEIGNVQYTAKVYNVGTVNLGPDKVAYNKKAVLDDLPYKLRNKKFGADSYKIKYGNDNIGSFSGYSLTDEGAIVKYDADGFITSVVCESTADVISDPSSLKVGNMTDLDSSSVAIIPGSASNYDALVESALFSQAMEEMYKDEGSRADWEQAVLGDSSVLDSDDFISSFKKLTKVYVNKRRINPTDANEVYEVSVDVYYYSNHSLFNGNYKVTPYNAYYQTFDVDKCPPIYFEYQPFTVDVVKAGTSETVTYTGEDYLMIESYVDDAKVYLYKPASDQMTVSTSGTGVKDGTQGEFQAEYKTTATGSAKSKLVIVGGKVPSLSNYSIPIYTNLDMTNFSYTSSSVPTTLRSIKSNVYSDNTGAIDYSSSMIQKLSDEQGRDANFYNVRVELQSTSSSGNRVLLTGAKGDN